jgi:hypothetical protein
MTRRREALVGESTRGDANNLNFKLQEWRDSKGTCNSNNSEFQPADEQVVIVPDSIAQARLLKAKMIEEEQSILDEFKYLKEQSKKSLTESEHRKEKVRLNCDLDTVQTQLSVARGFVHAWSNATSEKNLENIENQVGPILKQQIETFRGIKSDIKGGLKISDEEQQRIDDLRDFISDEITEQTWSTPLRSIIE